MRKGCVVMVEKEGQYENFIYRNDIKKCSIARSELHKKWLGIESCEGALDRRKKEKGEK